MTTLQEDIDQCKYLEQQYNDLIKKLNERPQMNYSLIQEAERKLCKIVMARLELESKGLA